MAEYLVEGWTAAIDYILKTQAVDATEATAYALNGHAVSIQVCPKGSTTPLTLIGTTTVSSDTTGDDVGLVAYKPGAGELLNSQSPYRVRYRVTDGNGKVAYFPNGLPVEWVVRKP